MDVRTDHMFQTKTVVNCSKFVKDLLMLRIGNVNIWNSNALFVEL